MTPVLDKLEPFFTRRNKSWEKKGVPPLWAWLSPALLLREGEWYGVGLFARQAVTPVLLISVFMFGITGIIWLWLYGKCHTHVEIVPVLNHFVRLRLWDDLLATLILMPFNFALEFPRLYFWNRRAKRLRGRQDEPVPPVVSVPVDPAVWPPPPNLTPRP